MLRHLAGIGAATLLIGACMFLPFMPGQYDGFAATLSAWSQLVGTVGLLLVPFGAIWLWYELKRRRRETATRPARDLGHGLALASLAVATLVALGFAAFAWGIVGRSLGFAVIALWIYCGFRLTRKLKAMKHAAVRTFNPAPLYLVAVPIVAAVLTFTLVGRAVGFSRNRAMENSAQLINDIERYRDANGHYPPSLLALWQDHYKPLVIGIEKYHYELNGEAYNVFFEQLSDQLGTREIVMYNKRDEHVMTSHTTDLLTLTPAELAYQRGYYAVNNASRPHWKYFWFD